MNNILVTAIGSFSADIVIKNLHESGNRIIGCDIYSADWVANSLFVDRFYQSPYATDETAYINFLSHLCMEEDVDYIIPLTDAEVDVINANRDVFSEVVLCISPKETISICRNKYDLYQYLKKCGVECLISTELLKNRSANRLEYPLVMKPCGGRSSQGLHYIDNSLDMEYYTKKYSESDYIIQPKISGTIITVDILRTDDYFVATPREELLRTPNGAGTSVRVFQDQKLTNISEIIAQKLNILGCVNFEFIKDYDGKYWFLECNPRFSGGIAFSCMSGYDYVNNHLRCFSKKSLDYYCCKELIIARKYKEYITREN